MGLSVLTLEGVQFLIQCVINHALKTITWLLACTPEVAHRTPETVCYQCNRSQLCMYEEFEITPFQQWGLRASCVHTHRQRISDLTYMLAWKYC